MPNASCSTSSVFAGGWTLGPRLCSDDNIDAAEVVQLLAHLVDRSLVLAEEHSGAMRYRQYETPSVWRRVACVRR
jgi:hypothetical protein